MPTPPPPPTPPKDVKPLSPTPISPKKYRSPSFSNLLRPSSASIHSSDDKSSSTSGTTEKEGGKLSAKVKEFFNKGQKSPPSSSTSLVSDAIAAASIASAAPATGVTVIPQIMNATPVSPGSGSSSSTSNALQISIVGHNPLSSLDQPESQQLATVAPTGADQFRHAVKSAQTSVERMESAALWLGYAAQGLSVAGAWLPMVGHGVQAVVLMLESAKEIGIAKVAALRLVERCADILEAILSKMKSQNGQISFEASQDINRLLTNIHNTAFLLTKLSNRPFFKLWMHAGEVQDQISEATFNIDIFFSIFHVQAALTTNAMLEQARNDREADQKILRDMIDAGIKDENVLLSMLVKKADEQQEAIKTLQRALDNIRAQRYRPVNTDHSPGGSPDLASTRQERIMDSPESLTIGLPTSSPLWLPENRGSFDRRRQSSATPSYASDKTDTSHLSVQGQKSESPPEGVLSSIDEMGKKMGKIRVDDEATVTLPARMAFKSTVEKEDPRREFIEKALDVLRRHSASTDYGVPDWTITSLEITHEIRIATSFFSTIWRGKWENEKVAIKELHRNIDRSLFITEVEVWRRLRSKHVLPFFGASSTTGPPPWFMISPYMQNGNILTFMRNSRWSASDRRQQVLLLIKQIAQGMEYLHSRDILHGDFKATNVLVSDIGEALICDFGLSQLKFDLNRRSGDDQEAKRSASGTMRWQSPERLLGKPLTPACDVYAFGITVCELYGVQDGEQSPFGYVDDTVVRKQVLDGYRPKKPDHLPKKLWAVVERCWAQRPNDRPTFETIVQELTVIADADAKRPKSSDGSPTTSSGSFDTAPESQQQVEQHALSPQLAHRNLPEDDAASSSSGSIRSIPRHLATEISFESDRAERHYRHYLNHDFDDRLSIPLWFPSEIPLGSVGYIRHGQFIKLFDATLPPTEIEELPPVVHLDEFASLATIKTPVNVQNVADKGWELVHSAWMNFKKSSGEKSQISVSRQYAFPLKPGGKQAILVVDDAQTEIYKSFSEPRSYLSGNIEWILKWYGDAHHIGKEDVIIIVGTLSAKNFAMTVTAFAPKTTLMFNVHTESQRKAGETWGTWAVNRVRTEGEADLQYICQVSTVNTSPRQAVLLAKLKFPPGGGEPALYP